MECKLRCVNFRRVSAARRQFLTFFQSIRDLWWLVQKYDVSDCDRSGNASERRRELLMHLGAPGSTGNKSGSANNKPESTRVRRRQDWECQHQPWEHHGAPVTILGAPWITVEPSGINNCCFGNAAGALRNYSYYFSFNSFWNSCIEFVSSSLYLYSYPTTHRISGQVAGGACEKFQVRLKMMIEWT